VESKALDIAGAQLIPLVPHGDERGSLTETYRRQWFPDGREVVQANLSRSRAGVLRGLHWHRSQTDLWCVLSGIAHVRLVDLREGSPTHLSVVALRFEGGDAEPAALRIPPGVAHGFYAETKVLLQYLVDAPYTGEDELGLAWDDPSLGISWPEAEPVLSQRDRSNPSLEVVLREPPAFAGP
jgi:dTDP-4-dehydrorhamnose 3,5-epimerase